MNINDYAEKYKNRLLIDKLLFFEDNQQIQARIDQATDQSKNSSKIDSIDSALNSEGGMNYQSARTEIENAIFDLLESNVPPSVTWRKPLGTLNMDDMKDISAFGSAYRKNRKTYFYEPDYRLIHLVKYEPVREAYSSLTPMLHNVLRKTPTNGGYFRNTYANSQAEAVRQKLVEGRALASGESSPCNRHLDTNPNMYTVLSKLAGLQNPSTHVETDKVSDSNFNK